MSIDIMSRLTLDDLLDQLEQARQMAIEERKPTAMIQATVMTAKLLGLDKPVIKDVNADEVQTISDLMNELADDEQIRTEFNKRVEYVRNEY